MLYSINIIIINIDHKKNNEITYIFCYLTFSNI